MKKILSTLLLVVILFNFIFSGKVQAESKIDMNDPGMNDALSGSAMETLISDGVATINGVTTQVTFDWNVIGAVVSIVARFLNLFPMLTRQLMMICSSGQVFGSLAGGQYFTIERAVFNQISIFNVDFFNLTSPYTYTLGNGVNEITITSNSKVENSIRTSVARYYYILRLIAMAISLLILIYVGIRMAISTISADKAKYKSMLIAWVESIVLLFFMQYIISFVIGAGNMFSNLMYDLKCMIEGNGAINFENTILEETKLLSLSGWSYCAYSVAFWALVFVQSKFFFTYFRRTITVGFLILIAPLITITYPIDKIGDGKAQAFTVWMNELVMNILIQPIHGLIYLIFIYTAGEIAKTSVFVALAFLLALTKFEKIILQLFNLRNVVSLRPVDEERKN